MTIIRLCSLLVFAWLIVSQPLLAKQHSAIHKVRPPQPLVLSNPKSTNKIVLGSMVRFFGDKGWASVSVQTPSGKSIPIFEPEGRPPEKAYQPGTWSPDGRYFVVIEVINIRYPTNKQDTAYIIDLKKAKCVDLNSSISPTFDHTSWGWVDGKPHSIQLIEGDTKEQAEPSD